MKNANYASLLLFTPLSLCYNALFFVYPFGPWLNTSHICLIRRFKAKEMSEPSGSSLPFFKMGGKEAKGRRKNGVIAAGP